MSQSEMELRVGDIVVYEGDTTDRFIGKLGVVMSEFDGPTPAVNVQWLLIDMDGSNIFKRNLRRIGHVSADAQT